MKMLMALLIFSSYVGAAPGTSQKSVPVPKNEQMAKKEAAQNKEPNALDKKPEDCDDKAKKPVEITPDSISLSGNTGCTLDEAKP